MAGLGESIPVMQDDTLFAGAEIATCRLDTAAIDRAVRADAYLEAIDRALDTEFLDDVCDAVMIGFHLGDVHVISLDASPRRSIRTHALIARDRHDGVSFQFVIAGHSVGRAGNRAIDSVPGTVAVFDFDQPFTMTDRGRRVVVNVAVPRRMLLSRIGDPSQLHGIVLHPPAINLFRDLMQSVVADRAAISAAEGRRIEGMVVETIAIMLARVGRSSLVDDVVGDTLLARAYAAMDARIGSQDLTPDWLVERLGVSRSELYRLFHDVGGVSKAIWLRRLDAAQAALADRKDDRRIGEIAYSLGFSSEAHFARAFKTRFAMTARAMRDDRRTS